MDAMLSSRLWNRLRIVGFGLVLIVNRLLIDVCSCSGGNSLCVIMPLVALRLVLVRFWAKSAFQVRRKRFSVLRSVVSAVVVCLC